jgi:hypothetical protein
MNSTYKNIATIGIIAVMALGSALASPQMTYYPNGLVITVPGTVLTNADITNPNGVGLVIRAENVVVENVRVHDTKSHGVLIQASYVTLRNSLIEGNVKGTCYPNCSGGWESGVKCQSKDGFLGLVHHVTIENNVVRNNLGEGMGLRCADILVKGNTVYDNFSFNIYYNSWNILVENNFVYCTGINLRDGYPAAGIGGQEEGFVNWPKSAHDITVRNNIVYGCKYGYRYGGAGGGVDPGLVRASIYNNTFYKTIMPEISIVYAPAQDGVTIYDNIARRVSYDGRGAVSWNNVDIPLVGGYDAELFQPAQHVDGEMNYPTDFFGNTRSLFTVGAVEWRSANASTPTVISSSTATPVYTPSRTNTPTKTSTPAPQTAPPTRTPTITPTHATWTPSATIEPTATATPTLACPPGYSRVESNEYIICVFSK